MGKLRVHNIEAQAGSNIDLGAAGDVVTLASDSIQTNLYKDSGGNTIFQSDGAGTLSNVNSSISGAGPKLIQSQTASNTASVSFTSGIDSTYDKYMFVCLNLYAHTNDQSLGFQVSTDGGSAYGVAKTTTFFNAYHYENDSGAGLQYSGASFSMANGTGIQYITQSQGNDADASASCILHLFAPSSTTYVKHFYARSSSCHQADIAQDNYQAGYVNSTSAVNAIQFRMGSGNVSGKFKLYGVS